MNRQTVPLAPTVGHTLGGLPVDGNGRCCWHLVSLVHGPLRRWRCSLHRLHGAAPLTGNRLLDALTSGSAAAIAVDG